MTDKDITAQLLAETKDQAKREKKEEKKEAPKTVASDSDRKVKTESIASETPQDRFRRIVKDQGYHTGVENMTSVFYEGDTDNPAWLDDVLKLSHIPAKNREMIITAYYGKPIKELGITVEPGFAGFGKKVDDAKKIEDAKKDDEIDFAKMSNDELKQSIQSEKSMLALAQMRKLRKELDAENKPKENIQQYQMRQVMRPIMKDGLVIRDKEGVILTETVVEPVIPGQQNSDIMNMLAMKALNPPPVQETKQTGADPVILEYIKKLDQKIETMESSRQIQAKEDEIKRMAEKLERKEEEFKKDTERKEKEFAERLDKMNEERIRDLNELKERFTETIQHKKELDDIIGQVTGSHKKEIDALKQKLEHTSTNIEKTIVSKSTDTVDKLTSKFGDIAESVVKPMAEVMKDHYKTVIDTTRINAGLPSLRDTVPIVNEDELEKFAREG